MFNVETIGVLYINYVNQDPERPFYSLNITQHKKDKDEYFYVNIFFKEGENIPENNTKIRVKGVGRLFKDKNTKVTRISIAEAEILEEIQEELSVTEEDVPVTENIKVSTDLFGDDITPDKFAF